ncbi:MAG: zinc-ribbon domain-containing protein, partial [Candidatus Adiutrix sp.]
MIITCGQCQSKFKVSPEQIKETGSKVRCSNCQYVFTVYRPRSVDNVAPSLLEPSLIGSDKISPNPPPLGHDEDDFVAQGPATTIPEHLLGDLAEIKNQFFDDEGDDQGNDEGQDYEDSETDDDSFPEKLKDGFPTDEIKQRRHKRRELYSDLEDSPGRATIDDDTLDDLFDDDLDLGFPANSTHPPLRRSGKNKPKADADNTLTQNPLDASDGDEDYDAENEKHDDHLGLEFD